jgi:pyridoxal phosphate enzyme (YggS family)
MQGDSVAMGLERVRRRIRDAAAAAGRTEADVRLVAVSKSKPASAVRRAHELGQLDFGENYVQELAAKAAELADLTDLRWHMIGHVQTNKAKVLLRHAWMVQTVDSERVAVELGKRAAQAGRTLPVLVEVNVGGEAQKSGVAAGEARSVLEAARAQPALEVRGLMTVPPFELEACETAAYFRALRELRDQLGEAGALPDLSMGMSHDFEEAIAAGATMVRVGTAIFGAR